MRQLKINCLTTQPHEQTSAVPFPLPALLEVAGGWGTGGGRVAARRGGWLVLKRPRPLRRVERCLVRAIHRWQRREAKRLGEGPARGGAVSFAQLFGSAVQLTPHLHVLVPEGRGHHPSHRVAAAKRGGLPKRVHEEVRGVDGGAVAGRRL